MTHGSRQFVLLFACEDRKGIVAAVANSLVSQDCNIVENAQYGDASTGRFFMRVKFTAPNRLTRQAFGEAFAPCSTSRSRRRRANVHPLRNTATLGLAGADLVEALTAWRHPPTIVAVPSPALDKQD